MSALKTACKNWREWYSLKKCIIAAIALALVPYFLFCVVLNYPTSKAVSISALLAVVFVAEVVSDEKYNRIMMCIILMILGCIFLYSVIDDLYSTIKISIGFFLLTSGFNYLMEEFGNPNRKVIDKVHYWYRKYIMADKNSK